MAWNSPMKPETIVRRAQDRAKAQHEQYLSTTRRMAALAAEEKDGAGLFTELLRDRLQTLAEESY